MGTIFAVMSGRLQNRIKRNSQRWARSREFYNRHRQQSQTTLQLSAHEHSFKKEKERKTEKKEKSGERQKHTALSGIEIRENFQRRKLTRVGAVEIGGLTCFNSLTKGFFGDRIYSGFRGFVFSYLFIVKCSIMQFKFILFRIIINL